MATICLNMIVKNEAHVIARALDTVKPFIDHWIIVDTGSTDGTQEIVRGHMKDIPGELFERPWRDFSHNRNEAMDLAKGKAGYLLFLDADEEFVVPAGWRMPELTADCYRLPVHHPPDLLYDRVSLVATRMPWRYVGVLHEFIQCDQPHDGNAELKGPFIRENPEGARAHDPDKWRKDVALLQEGLIKEPGNRRYTFYLAQTYCGASQWKEALSWYQKRAAMGGWDEEVWFCQYQVARLSEIMKASEGVVVFLYLRSHQLRPWRAESLYSLAIYCRVRKLWSLAYIFAREAASIPQPAALHERLFVQRSVYEWRALDEWSIAAYETKHYAESKLLYEQLLAKPDLPKDDRQRVQSNLDLALKALAETPVSAAA